MNLKRYTDNRTVGFLRFLVGLREPSTAVTPQERTFLAGLVRGKRCIVEVGVFEGATSRVFCAEMDPGGKLYLVDPFFPEVRLERLLGVSFTQWVAHKAVRPWRVRVEFIQQTSQAAAASVGLQGQAEFIFIDARHDYDSARQDFECWAPMLAEGAVMAFHDSHPCPTRPELSYEEGAARLVAEVLAGQHGAWEKVGDLESVTAVRRRSA